MAGLWKDASAERKIHITGAACSGVTPMPVRMARLRQREREGYGDRILPGGDMRDIHTAFAAGASHYDDPTLSGRTIRRHEAWLAERRAPMPRLDGTRPRKALIADLLNA